MAGSSWQRRNDRARAAGYRNYYDYRAHDNGRLPPSAPALKGELLARSRGHRGVSDFRRAVAGGRVSMAQVYESERGANGKMKTVSLLVTDKQGRQRLYRLKVDQLPPADLAALEAELEAQGVDVREYTRKTKIGGLLDEDEERELDDELDALDDAEEADLDAEIPF